MHDDKSQSEGHTADTVWCDGGLFFCALLDRDSRAARMWALSNRLPMFVCDAGIAVQSGILAYRNYRYTRHYKWRYDNSIFMLAAAPLPFFDTRYLIFQIARSSYARPLYSLLSIGLGRVAGSGAYSFFPAAVGGSAAPPTDATATTLRAGRGFLLRCIAWATTLSLRHRNQHYRTTTCPHTGCHVSTIYFPHPPIAPLNLIPQKPQRISPLIARR